MHTVKQRTAGSITAPASGKATIFVDIADGAVKAKLPNGSTTGSGSAGMLPPLSAGVIGESQTANLTADEVQRYDGTGVTYPPELTLPASPAADDVCWILECTGGGAAVPVFSGSNNIRDASGDNNSYYVSTPFGLTGFVWDDASDVWRVVIPNRPAFAAGVLDTGAWVKLGCINKIALNLGNAAINVPATAQNGDWFGIKEVGGETGNVVGIQAASIEDHYGVPGQSVHNVTEHSISLVFVFDGDSGTWRVTNRSTMPEAP